MAAAGVGYASGFDDSLEPDTDFALEASGPDWCPEVTALPAWACAAGRIRLLARQQAKTSAMVARRSVAEDEGAQTLSTDSWILQMEENTMRGDVFKAPFAKETAQESIARPSAVLAEFEALHRTILNWA